MNHSTSPHCYLTHIVIVRTKVGSPMHLLCPSRTGLYASA
jgi:hypothetical protein